MSSSPGGKPSSFSWSGWQDGLFPSLADHSSKKLDLLRDYIVLYLRIVCQNVHGKESQPINFVDGFAGGGLYDGGHLGSPLVLLRAVEEAEAIINQGRTKKITLTPTYYFIEKSTDAFACLESTLKEQGYGHEIGKAIKLIRGDFTANAMAVADDICRRHPRGGGRTIFFLDQCGYVQVSPKLIAAVHERLSRKSEFIVNFAIDWLTDFLSHDTGYEQILTSLDIDRHVNLSELISLKKNLPDWRYIVEAKIGEALRAASGLPFFSPFYIEPEDNHRGYWLLHLAPVARARAAMTTVHWKTANRSRHYGPRGLGILHYKPELDRSLYLDGMTFNDTTRKECADLLAEDLPRTIRDRFADGISAKALEEYCTNRTIADFEMFTAAIWRLVDDQALRVTSPSGKLKRGRTLAPNDQILFNTQMPLFSLPPVKARSA